MFIPKKVIDSESYYYLSGGAAKLLSMLSWQYKMNPMNGNGNNGNLTVAVSVIGDYCGSKNTITKYKNELIEAGLIVCTRQPEKMPSGRFSTALYGLSWLPIDDIWVNGERIKLDIHPTVTPPRIEWKKHIISKAKNKDFIMETVKDVKAEKKWKKLTGEVMALYKSHPDGLKAGAEEIKRMFKYLKEELGITD